MSQLNTIHDQSFQPAWTDHFHRQLHLATPFTIVRLSSQLVEITHLMKHMHLDWLAAQWAKLDDGLAYCILQVRGLWRVWPLQQILPQAQYICHHVSPIVA